jgi:sugar phosphate isomerase/epimerase
VRTSPSASLRTSLTATPSAARFAPIVCRGDPRQAFDLAAALGYDGVELHLRRPTDVDPPGLLKLLADTGLGVPTLGTGMAAGEDGLTFAHDDPAVARQAVARIAEHIRLAAAIGSAVTIGLIWGRVGADPRQRPERMRRALECLAECCRTAEAAGVPLLLEPLNRYESDYPQTVAQGLEVLQTVGSPKLKLLADTFHMNIEETSILASLRAAGPHLGHVHLADTNRQAPGHGHLDVAAVLQTLADMGYAGYLSLEVLPLPDTRTAAEDGLRTIRSCEVQR